MSDLRQPPLCRRPEGPAHARFWRGGVETCHPEIIVFNETTDLRHNMINSIGKRVKAGEKFEPRKGYSGIIGNFDVQFRPVHPARYWDWVNFACWSMTTIPPAFPSSNAFIPI